jgi:hypothetical protein
MRCCGEPATAPLAPRLLHRRIDSFFHHNEAMKTFDDNAGFGTRATHIAALMALAVLIGLAAPGRSDGTPEDAVAEGIVAAQHCEVELDRSVGRWADCIGRQEAALATSSQASAGLHFQAWLTADRVAQDGEPSATEHRAAHAHQLARALDDNLLTLHRLCTASGADCDAVGVRLAAVL